jgi:hypothetical protein
MLILAGKTGLDPFREKSEEGIDISVPWPIDGTRTEDEERKFLTVRHG